MKEYDAIPDALLVMGVVIADEEIDIADLLEAESIEDYQELVVALAAIAVGLGDAVSETGSASAVLHNMAHNEYDKGE